MSNLTWKKLWKDVIIDFYNLSNSAPEPLIFDSALKINNLFIKNSNKEFKIYENINKNKNFFSISLKNENYKNECEKWKEKNKELLQIFKLENNSINLMDLKIKNCSLKYLITINTFIDKIINNENYFSIINRECKILTETFYNFFIGLKKYNNIYKKFKKNFFVIKIFNNEKSLKENEKNIKNYKNFILECRENIKTVFDDRVELYKTFYSLLEKVYWEYLNFNLPQNLKEKFKNDVGTKFFISKFLKKNFDKYKYWTVNKYDDVNELLIFEKKNTLLKKIYDNHVLLESIIEFRNKLEHELIPKNKTNLHLFIETNILIGLIMELINSIEKFFEIKS